MKQKTTKIPRTGPSILYLLCNNETNATFLVMAVPTSDINFYFDCQLQCNKPPQNLVSLKKTHTHNFTTSHDLRVD